MTMNNIRRKEIRGIIDELETLAGKLDDLYSWLDELKSEEEEYRDNIPENLQGGIRYEESEEASDNMEYASDALYDLSLEMTNYIEDVIGYLENAVA